MAFRTILFSPRPMARSPSRQPLRGENKMVLLREAADGGAEKGSRRGIPETDRTRRGCQTRGTPLKIIQQKWDLTSVTSHNQHHCHQQTELLTRAFDIPPTYGPKRAPLRGFRSNRNLYASIFHFLFCRIIIAFSTDFSRRQI